MSGDVLSQAEVESLLNAMDGRESDVDRRRGDQPDPASRQDLAVRLQASRARRQGADALAADDARGLRPQFRRGPLGPAADDRRGEAHERRSAHVQRVRVQPRESDLLQPDQRGAARRAVDSRHQSVALVSDHRSAVGRRQRARRRRSAGRSRKSSCGSCRGSPTCSARR